MFEDTVERTWRERLFSRPTGVEEAFAICRDVGMAIVLLAVVAGAVSLILFALAAAYGSFSHMRGHFGVGALLISLAGASLSALLGVLIWRVRSRMAAVIALILFCISALVRLGLLVTRGPFGLVWLSVGVVLVWASIRAVQGTFAAHRFAVGSGGAVPGAKSTAI
jgi:hypothetical protein